MSFAYVHRVAVVVAILATAGCTIKDTVTPPLTAPSPDQGVILPALGAPTAKFTFLPTAPAANAQVLFDGSTSTPGTGALLISAFNWNFGDGATGAGKSVTHAFTTGVTASTFVVTLTVTNDRGLSASTSQEVKVDPPLPPVADFVFSPSAPIAEEDVNFVSTSVTPSGAPIVAYSWNFGDGRPTCPGVCGTGTQSAPNHKFPAVPNNTVPRTPLTTTYQVVLTVRDSNNQTGTKVISVPVITP